MFVSDSILREKAKEFAKEIVFTCRDMKKDKKELEVIRMSALPLFYVLSKLL